MTDMVDLHLIYLLAAAGIIGVAVYGLLAADHLLRKLLALNLLGSGVFLLMVTLPSRGGTPDPVSHALVLTGLVVAVSITAFALALLDRLYRETGEIRLETADAGFDSGSDSDANFDIDSNAEAGASLDEHAAAKSESHENTSADAAVQATGEARIRAGSRVGVSERHDGGR